MDDSIADGASTMPAKGRASDRLPQNLRVVVDARYLCDPFGSMTVFCRNLLHALVDLDLGAAPAALVPRELHASGAAVREELGASVDWVRPARDRHHIGRLGRELEWVHRAVPSMLANSVPDADVVIMPYHHPPARASGVRRVVVLHDLCGLGVGFPKHKKAYWQHYLRLRAAAHLADTIWPISLATRDEMATRFPPSRRRLGPVIYNGVDRRPIPADQVSKILKNHGLKARDYVVAFATWQERKNFTATLAALTALRGRARPLRLVGIAPEREAASIRERCIAEGHHDALILSGIATMELDALYAGALALLWPSTCEGFGYPVVEAMAQGCPPLVASCGPGAELVQGTVEPLDVLDPAYMAERVEILRNSSPSDQEHLRRILRERAGAFSPDNYRDQLFEALKRL